MSLCGNLPIEIWSMIIRNAIINPCTDDRFYPPPNDIVQCKALQLVNSSFKAIVGSVSRENIQIVSIEEIEGMPSHGRQAVRCV